MSSFLLKSAVATGVGIFVETKYGPALQPTYGGLSPLFAATPLVLIGVGFFGIAHGMAVGKARAKYMEKAKKDGEENVEDRYGLPNLYAQGTSPNVKAFNAVQRSHQQIFETYTQMVLFGLAGAVEFPIATACATTMYAVGRVIFSVNYAASDGDASKRYSNKLARFNWYGLLVTFMLGASSCVKILASTSLATE